jgi:hypothetical protein
MGGDLRWSPADMALRAPWKAVRRGTLDADAVAQGNCAEHRTTDLSLRCTENLQSRAVQLHLRRDEPILFDTDSKLYLRKLAPALQGKAGQETTEAMLFTDTWITGEIPELGPYALLNTIAHGGVHGGRILRPAVVMRIAHHYDLATDPAYRSPMQNDFEH